MFLRSLWHARKWVFRTQLIRIMRSEKTLTQDLTLQEKLRSLTHVANVANVFLAAAKHFPKTVTQHDTRLGVLQMCICLWWIKSLCDVLRLKDRLRSNITSPWLVNSFSLKNVGTFSKSHCSMRAAVNLFLKTTEWRIRALANDDLGVFQ